MNIRDILDEAIKQAMNKQEIYSIVCNVDSVDTGDRTCVCTPINGGAELQDVRIQASLGGTTGLFIEPEVDSKVIVSFLSREIAYVSLFSEIKNVYLDFSDKVIFNGGLNGAMVKIGDLVGRLNDIEDKVNDIISVYNGHTHVETGASTNATLSTVLGYLTLTVEADIDNPEIEQ
jgi:hypothetical protein